MPEARKQTLRNLAQHYIDNDNSNNPQGWYPLHGIGPWTVDYAKLWGLSDPDIYLGAISVLKKPSKS